KDVVHYVDQGDKRTDFLDRIFLHPVLGLLSLAIMMFIVFQAVFAWAAPFMDGIEGFFGWLGEVVGTVITQPLLHSLVVDGIIAGAGGVVVF
ncbi:ferrous iron transporter B, partial [Acinetobacter baumannii]